MSGEREQITFVREYLKRFKTGDKGSSKEKDEIKENLTALKRQVVSEGKQEVAKEIWCLEEILNIQKLFISSFEDIRKETFYAAWCGLERCEVKLKHLKRHFSIDKGDTFGLSFIQEKVQLLQGLFPYKMFTSPEFIIQEQECSTCGQKISLRTSCGHIIGEIYDGEPCCRVIKKVKLLALSATKNPRNKYTVMFLVDEKTGEKTDHYDYSLLKGLNLAVQSPFDEWSYYWTKKRHPHSRYKNIGKNDICPCESGRKYKKCCLNEEGVLRPHLEFTLSKKPLNSLPEIVYTG